MVSTKIYSVSLPEDLIEKVDLIPGTRSGKITRALNLLLKYQGEANVVQELATRLEGLVMRLDEVMHPVDHANIRGMFRVYPLCTQLGLTWAEMEAYDEGTTVVLHGERYGTRATANLLFSEFRSRAEPPARVNIDVLQEQVMTQLQETQECEPSSS